MERSGIRTLSSLILWVTLGLSQSNIATAGNCDPEQLSQAMQNCGMDMGCILQATNDFNAGCQGGQPPTP